MARVPPRPTSDPPLDVVDEDGGTACSARNGTDGRDGLVAGWLRLAVGRIRAVVMPSSDGYVALVSVVLGKGFPFYGRSGLQQSPKPTGVSGVYNTELDNGPSVRSQRHERGCGRRCQSGVLASYGHDTERMGSTGPKNRPCWGEEREELRVLASSARDCNEEKFSKSFVRS
jgi:hypothetical protein